VSKPANWGTVYLRRRKETDSPPPRLNGARPEVLPQESPEEANRKEERDAWLRGVLAEDEP
jgi:hypothetical protein